MTSCLILTHLLLQLDESDNLQQVGASDKTDNLQQTCGVLAVWNVNHPMDHSPIQQTFEFGKSISTAGKSILNFIQLSNYKIQSCKVGEFCILLYYERKSVTTMWKCGNAFSRVIQKYTKFANFTLLYFQQFTIFCNQTSQFH